MVVRRNVSRKARLRRLFCLPAVARLLSGANLSLADAGDPTQDRAEGACYSKGDYHYREEHAETRVREAGQADRLEQTSPPLTDGPENIAHEAELSTTSTLAEADRQGKEAAN
jgi:hypothetical protein